MPAPLWLRGIVVGLLFTMLSIQGLAAPSASRRKATPERLKAVFIQNFATATQWPTGTFADTNAPFVIGLLDAKALHAPLAEAFRNLKLHGRPVDLRVLKASNEAKACQLVFVGRRESAALREACGAAAGQPVLVITEQPGALAAGSILNFWQTEDDSMRFEFNSQAMKQARLEVSADVIELAQPNPKPGSVP